MSTTVIALERVTKRYGDVVAVDEVTLAVGAGEFFSILGPSGCGKTTTLRLVAGFEQPSGGRVLLDGIDVSGVPPYVRHVNTVFQHYALFPHMTVFENVAFGPHSRKAPQAQVRESVREILDVVRLGHLAARRPSALSGGEQQRVALARALVNRPSAVLLDEPLGALDLKLREAMRVELKSIQRGVGIAFVHVTHDQEEALALSDRLAVMSGGRVEQIGTPVEVYRRPASAFVADFIGSANVLDGGTVVRPEDVSVTPGGDATVVSRSFEGASVRLVVRRADGSEVQARVAARSESSSLEPGAAVTVTWTPEAAYRLPG